MNNLLKYLAEYVQGQFDKQYGQNIKELRLNFTGIPEELRNKLFDYFKDPAVRPSIELAEEKFHVPVYLFEDKSSDPEDCPDFAKCSESWWVRAVRNNQSKKVCLILSDMISQGSVLSTINVIGIPREVNTVDEWLEQDLLRELADRILTSIFTNIKIAEKAKLLLNCAIQNAWDAEEGCREKTRCWNLLEKAAEVHGANEHDTILNFLAHLGFPSISKLEDFGSKEHLSVLLGLASFLNDSGLNAGFRKLIDRADNPPVKKALEDFENHLFEMGVNDATEFAISPFRFFKPLGKTNFEIPEWWNTLNCVCLADLLDYNQAVSEGSIIIEPQDPLLPAQSGLPHLFRNKVTFSISIGDTESEVSNGIEIKIYRASGSSKLQLIKDGISISNEGPLEYEDDDLPEHDRFVRYKIEAEGFKPSVVKVISLDNYKPGVVVFSRSAKKVSLFKENTKAKSRANENKKQPRFESNLSLKNMGKHNLELFTSKNFDPGEIMHGYEIDSEHINEDIERPINKVDENKYVCLIDTDEECEWEFFALGNNESDIPYLIYVTAEDIPQQGVSTEFERLVLSNLPDSEGGNSTNVKVEPKISRISEYEEWILNNDDSYYPVIIGPDYIDCWKNPDWKEKPVLSQYRINEDPRPLGNDFEVSEDFISSRTELFKILKESFGDNLNLASVSLLKFGDLMKSECFKGKLNTFLKSYINWIEKDFSSAFWADTLSVFGNIQGMEVLGAKPYAILLSPFHPLRLAWQCNAQHILQDAAEKNMNCPAASLLNPGSFPDCITLPCRTASNQINYIDFVAMPSTSSYWGVLWSVEALDLLASSDSQTIFDVEFGIEVQGLSGGFSSKQVERSIDEVWRLLSAKSSLRLGIRSRIRAQTSCNQGIEDWCLNNLGAESDPWNISAPRSLIVNDQREPELHPEQSALSILTRSTGSAVSWFHSSDTNCKMDDLAVIAHLGLMNSRTEKHGINSAIDGSCLSRWRVRKGIDQAFIAESRIGKSIVAQDGETLGSLIIETIDKIESRCSESFDSFVFAPNMAELDIALTNSSYAAVSSAQVDASSFFGRNDKSYLWDYELPNYGKRAIDNAGYFLLAKENDGMRKAVRVAIEMLGEDLSIEDDNISSLLDEISRRGIPTLKHLTAGGTSSLGEVGMLCALKLFQPEFQKEYDHPGIIPVWTGEKKVLNLIIPIDPFQNHFENLRFSMEKKRGERPDLIVVSIKFDDEDQPKNIKLTSIEVKARGDKFDSAKRKDALKQASGFSGFLNRLITRGNGSEIWAFGWRSLLSTLVDYAFRVYSQLDFIDKANWASKHSDVLQGIAANDIAIDVDDTGRLLVVDRSDTSSPEDIDRDGFDETIVLNHKDALSVINGTCSILVSDIREKVNDWKLMPLETVQKNEDVEATIREAVVLDDDSALSDQSVENDLPSISNVAGDSKAESLQEKIANEISIDEENPVGLKFKVGSSIGNFTEEDFDFFPGNTNLTQFNTGIVGDMGTGKTQLTKALIYNLTKDAKQNRGVTPNILIFDYKKDYIKEDFVKATGARVIKPLNMPLNLFDLRGIETKREARQKINSFIDILEKIYPNIGPVQRENLKEAVKACFEIDGNGLGTVGPTLKDIFVSYKENNSPDSPYSIISDLVDGEYFSENKSDILPFSEVTKGVVVVNLFEVGADENAKNVLVTIFLNLFYEHMLKIEKQPFIGCDPQLRFIHSMLLVDEADNIMRYEFRVLKQLLQQGREFGVGIILASQYLSHFKTRNENYREPLKSWFIHNVPDINARELQQIGLTNVDPSVIDKIKNLNLHECLYKSLGVDGKFMRGTPFYELIKNR